MTEIPQHSRVALKNGTESVYTFCLAGSEGWARDSKTDDDGFKLLLIEWDKDHWRYNGQPDGYSFASHFKVIGPPEPPVMEEDEEVDTGDEPEARIEVANFLAQIKADMSEPSEADSYMEELSDAMESASESEGFVMFTVKRSINPDNPNEVLFAPEIHSATLSEEARLILDVQLAECASQSYQDMISHLMELLIKSRKESDDD